jgi:pyruvate dehydrogenase E2 component (dihydrolipoamide acetyltransferase)
MEGVLRLRERERCSTTAMLVRACALGLREVPRANGAYRDGRFELYSRVNVGVAVRAGAASVIPTVFDADGKTLTSLTAELEELAEGARGGVLPAPAFSGATFTLYDLGADEVMSASAITNPPQAAALAAGAMREAPLVRGGALVAGQLMSVTLACDHRILYGQEAARFLAAVKEKLERGAL